jgi:hypothetical protein
MELRPRKPLPLAPHLGLYTRALLVSKDRRHLFVTPDYKLSEFKKKIGQNRKVLKSTFKCIQRYAHCTCGVTMKKTCEGEGKMFASSLNSCPETAESEFLNF